MASDHEVIRRQTALCRDRFEPASGDEKAVAANGYGSYP